MADQTQLYIGAAAVGGQALSVTGRAADGVSAGGYAAWIYSITGEIPIVTEMPGNRIKLSLSQAQVVSMRKWLDVQVKKAVSKGDPSGRPTVEMELSPVLGPWALQYAIPFMAVTFTLGWLAHWFINRRRA